MQPGLLVQLLGGAQPFRLGWARPKRTAEQGVGIEDTGPLGQAYPRQDREQEPPGPGLQQLLQQGDTKNAASHRFHALSLLKSGVSSTRSRRW